MLFAVIHESVSSREGNSDLYTQDPQESYSLPRWINYFQQTLMGQERNLGCGGERFPQRRLLGCGDRNQKAIVH